MWSDLLFSLNIVLPIMLIIAVGFAARKLGLIGPEGIKQGNRCVFYIFLPLLLFSNIRNSQIDAGMDIKTIVYVIVTVLLCFGLLFYFIPRIARDRNTYGILIQGIARANYAIYGIPLVMLIYPNSDTSIAAIIVICVIPIFNVLSTIALMRYGSAKKRPIDIVLGILRNPLIIGTVLGLFFLLFQIPIPTVIDIPIQKLGSIATPFALFLLGTNMNFGESKSNLRILTFSVIARLVFFPILFLTGAVLIGIRDVSLATLIALYGSPTAVSSFPMAQQLGGDADLASQQVFFTTAFSGFTIFFWILILKSLGFLA